MLRASWFPARPLWLFKLCPCLMWQQIGKSTRLFSTQSAQTLTYFLHSLNKWRPNIETVSQSLTLGPERSSLYSHLNTCNSSFLFMDIARRLGPVNVRVSVNVFSFIIFHSHKGKCSHFYRKRRGFFLKYRVLSDVLKSCKTNVSIVMADRVDWEPNSLMLNTWNRKCH